MMYFSVENLTIHNVYYKLNLRLPSKIILVESSSQSFVSNKNTDLFSDL